MKQQVIEKFTTLITTAFGLVAALAWNDVIKQFIENLDLKNFGPIVYAFIVTLLAVFATVWLGKLSEKTKNLNIKDTLQNLQLFAGLVKDKDRPHKQNNSEKDYTNNKDKNNQKSL